MASPSSIPESDLPGTETPAGASRFAAWIAWCAACVYVCMYVWMNVYMWRLINILHVWACVRLSVTQIPTSLCVCALWVQSRTPNLISACRYVARILRRAQKRIHTNTYIYKHQGHTWTTWFFPAYPFIHIHTYAHTYIHTHLYTSGSYIDTIFPGLYPAYPDTLPCRSYFSLGCPLSLVALKSFPACMKVCICMYVYMHKLSVQAICLLGPPVEFGCA